MAFEIVDGMTGTKHINSDDLSALNVATIGKADCVLEYGDDFALTMQSANSATLGTGVGMVGGKRFWNQAAASLTIQSGTQGQKRNDLVVARYAKTSAGIESITPVVIKGAPTTGTAADPEATSDDLKLWRVPLDGINAGAPVRLFEPITPLATLGDSVSPVKLAVGTKVLNPAGNAFCDLMSYANAATELGCTVADFAKDGAPSARLACFVSNGDPSANSMGHMHAEINDAKRQVRVQFGQAVSGNMRVNWMLALDAKP